MPKDHLIDPDNPHETLCRKRITPYINQAPSPEQTTCRNCRRQLDNLRKEPSEAIQVQPAHQPVPAKDGPRQLLL